MKSSSLTILLSSFPLLGDKEQADIEREREIYEYQQQSPPSHQQTVHLTPNHPHLRHIGHPPSSLICIQSPHQPHQQLINSSSQSTVQNQCTSSSQQSGEQLHEMQIKKDSQSMHPSHYHSSQNGESRPSVIESSQPMIIECT
jgi:hypothetical protein